jgi:hypothetical protein
MTIEEYCEADTNLTLILHNTYQNMKYDWILTQLGACNIDAETVKIILDLSEEWDQMMVK